MKKVAVDKSEVIAGTSYSRPARPSITAPTVSVIITNYNYARYLRDAIESALAQTYPGVEVIVVDDGSVDDSRDIIRDYDGRVVPVLKENGGQASAFTAGLARSQGDVVIFLDADDVLLPHTARQVADVLCANPDIAKIQYRMEMIDAAGGRTGKIMPERYIPMPDGDLRAQALMFPADIPRMATSGNAFPAWVLQELAPIPETGDSVGADWYLAYISLLLGPVISIDGVGALYRTPWRQFLPRVDPGPWSDARGDQVHPVPACPHEAACRPPGFGRHAGQPKRSAIGGVSRDPHGVSQARSGQSPDT